MITPTRNTEWYHLYKRPRLGNLTEFRAQMTLKRRERGQAAGVSPLYNWTSKGVITITRREKFPIPPSQSLLSFYFIFLPQALSISWNIIIITSRKLPSRSTVSLLLSFQLNPMYSCNKRLSHWSRPFGLGNSYPILPPEGCFYILFDMMKSHVIISGFRVSFPVR